MLITVKFKIILLSLRMIKGELLFLNFVTLKFDLLMVYQFFNRFERGFWKGEIGLHLTNDLTCAHFRCSKGVLRRRLLCAELFLVNSGYEEPIHSRDWSSAALICR